jgi:nucleotide-binding universal stress UspA family protein
MDAPAIVLGVDFSPASERALEAAIQVAKEWHARLELVHAQQPLGAPGLDLFHPQFDSPRNESADVESSNPAIARSWVDKGKAAGVLTHLVSRPGPAADAILAEARHLRARAIIVGSHGRGDLGKAVLGSVAEAVLQRSPVPVLVVPGHTGPTIRT